MSTVQDDETTEAIEALKEMIIKDEDDNTSDIVEDEEPSSTADQQKLQDLAAAVRAALQQKHPELATMYDGRDVARVLGTAWVESYLLETNSKVDKAVRRLEATLRWRREFGTNDIDEATIPAEVLEKAVHYARYKAKDGTPVFWLHMNHTDPEKAFTKEVAPLARRYSTWALDMVHRRDPCAQITVIADCSLGFNKPTMKALDHMRWWVKTGINHYPNITRRCLFVGLPKRFVGLVKTLLTLVPKRYKGRILYVKPDEVKEYVDLEFLPAHMGGTNTDIGKYVPWTETAPKTVDNWDVSAA